MKPRSGRLYGGVNPHPFEYSSAIVESPWAWRSRAGVYAALGPLCDDDDDDVGDGDDDDYNEDYDDEDYGDLDDDDDGDDSYKQKYNNEQKPRLRTNTRWMFLPNFMSIGAELVDLSYLVSLSV